jgi:hypothetical protein
LPKGNAVNIPQTGRGYCVLTQVSSETDWSDHGPRDG